MSDSDSFDVHEVYSASRVSVTLRSILKGFWEGGEEAVPVLIAESGEGEPEAVLLPYGLFRMLVRVLDDDEDRAVEALAAARIGCAESADDGGLDNEALARIVAEGRTGPTG
jgi:hypothetical protein